MPRLGCVLVLAGLGACSEHGLDKVGDGTTNGDVPEIEVLPTRLDFGVSRPGESEVRRFTIRNAGSLGSELEVESVELEGDGAFTILEAFDPTVLGRDDEVDVEVHFAAEELIEYTGRAKVRSNDEDEDVVFVDLVASLRTPKLQISPDPLDMGELWLGCASEDLVYLTNVGNEDLIVGSLSLAGDGFSFVDPPDLPLLIPPSDSVPLPIVFAPETEGDYSATLTATSNEPDEIRHASQLGKATTVPQRTEVFDVPLDPPVDILFYVDQSWSMEDDASNLAENFRFFIERLGEIAPDWQVLVAIEDDGCTRFPILTPTTGDYDTTFLTAVTQGDGGVWTEAGLTVTANALDATGPGECNEGFVRPDGMVHAILVSDEAEQSPNAWDSYVARMQEAVGDPGRLHISAIAGDFPAGCSTPENSAAPGSGYWEAVSATGGVFLSICTDWWTNVETLADITLTRDTFWLSYPPDPETLVVNVNGRARTDWTYDAEGNAVVFNGEYLPIEGDVVEVVYTQLLVCP